MSTPDISETNLSTLKKGYSRAADRLQCLYCGFSVPRGEVYPHSGRYLKARRAMEVHIEEGHGGPFRALLAMGREATGLSAVQEQVLAALQAGESDAAIARGLGNKAHSTVRNHRFQLRQRYREAKILVVLTELLADSPREERLVDFPPHIRADDDRRLVTEGEEERILAKYLPAGTLLSFPKKEKAKLVILKALAGRLERGREYGEKEINTILNAASGEYVTLRRYLVEYGFIGRTEDCSRYWLR